MSDTDKCPVPHGARNHTAGGTTNRDWWPNQLNLDVLHLHSSKSNPLGEVFNYAKEFKSLDLKALKKDLRKLMKKPPTSTRPMIGAKISVNRSIG